MSQALEDGDAKIALEIGKSLGLFTPVQLPEGPETLEELEEHRTAVTNAVQQAALETPEDRERRAHRQARVEAEKAYQDELLEALTPMDEAVYERRLAELLGQEGSEQQAA